ncbi:aspartate aminotransferase family protein [Metabacillus arenae]|nr:aspartate aminotransferase family protein [Metabacillus arenae]
MKSFLIKPVLDENYKKISHGKGVFLYDEDGKRYIDGSSGAVTCSIGHGVEEIIEVMNEQAQKISFVYRSHFTNEPAEKLAEELARVLPGSLNFSFFVNSGSEAVETALKVALQYWQEKGQYRKTKIISRWMSYHGITIGSLSLSGHTDRRFRFVPLLDTSPTIHPPYCYRCPYDLTYPDCQLKCAAELEVAIKRIGADHIAAFIAEPVIGAAGGAITPPHGYYQRLKEICGKHNILFIADEVMTGIGRTGKMLASEHWNFVPDIVALGKGLSAGYTPLAAAVVSDHVMEPIVMGSKMIMSGHTYSANPQSTAVGLAVLNYIEKNQLVSESLRKGSILLNELRKLQVKYSIVGEVRGVGMLTGMEFVSDIFKRIPFRKEINLTNFIVMKAKENGLIVYPSSTGIEGDSGDAILIAPPLTITEEELQLLIDLLDKTLYEVEKHLQVSEINPA